MFWWQDLWSKKIRSINNTTLERSLMRIRYIRYTVCYILVLRTVFMGLKYPNLWKPKILKQTEHNHILNSFYLLNCRIMEKKEPFYSIQTFNKIEHWLLSKILRHIKIIRFVFATYKTNYSPLRQHIFFYLISIVISIQFIGIHLVLRH